MGFQATCIFKEIRQLYIPMAALFPYKRWSYVNYITKTRLFKYIENFTTKNLNFVR